ncbi:MAG TPA: hypothetical protein VIL05_02555 [Thermoclostridium sp.]
MGKKELSGIILIVLGIASGILLFTAMAGKRPFRELKHEQVQSISLFAVPPGITVDVKDKKQIEEIAEMLNDVVVYREDNSGREYVGQLVRYTLFFTDGTVLEAGTYNPFIFINDKCYRTKYKPCEKLNAYGNKLIKKAMSNGD